jgi:hypothetical protein
MRAFMRDAGAAERAAHHHADGVDPQGLIVRGLAPNEHGRLVGGRALVADVVLQCLARELEQRQHILALGLRALERDGAALPVDVVEPHAVDLGTAETQIERQADDGVASLGRAKQARAHEGVQDAVDLCGRKGERQRRRAPVWRRGDHAQQRTHRIAAAAAPAQIPPQRGVDCEDVARRVAQLEPLGNEAAHVLGRQPLELERPAGKLGEQQALNDAQLAAARAGGQTSCIAHAGVVARELVDDRSARRRQVADDVAPAQQRH